MAFQTGHSRGRNRSPLRQHCGDADLFQQLSELDTEGVEPTAHIAPLTNVLREDEPFSPRLDRDLLLSGTESEDGLITLPKVIG